MSWHYLQALVGESSGGTCSDGEPSAPWKRSRTVEKCSYEGSETACFPCSQSGTTATRSTDDHGMDSWMLSLRDSPVSRSLLQENKAPEKTSETAGPPPFAFLEKSDQGLPCWKTSQGCFPGLMATLDRYSEAWPRSGTMQCGTAFQLQPSAHLTREIDYGSWPTPLASDGEKAATDSLARLVETGHRRGRLDGLTREGKAITVTYPTPTTQDAANNGGASQHNRNSKPLNAVVGGKLNPTWVAWLMGWPIGWTDLEPLEMDRWLQWCHSHGIHS